MFSENDIDPASFGDTDFRRTQPRFNPPNFAFNMPQIRAFRDWANGRGWTASAAALAWIFDQGDHMIPIPGTRSAAHLREWAGACEISFTDQDRADIARLLPPGFAHGDRYSDAQLVGIERYC